MQAISDRRSFCLWVVFVCFLTGCDDTFFPPGLYDYQVERLLSGGGTKAWGWSGYQTIAGQVRPTEGCPEEWALLVTSRQDSLEFRRLVASSCPANTYDTVFLGVANASGISDGLLFADSLVFSDNRSWTNIFLTSRAFRYTDDSANWSYFFQD